jgi:hypothetical protein
VKSTQDYALGYFQPSLRDSSKSLFDRLREVFRMYIHMFAFRWKPGVTDVQKTRVRIEIRNLQGQIPGLLETWVGTNISPRSLGYELGGVMKFADEASLLAYPNHPVHVKLVNWLMPLIEPVEVDFSLEERGYGSGHP